MKRVMILGQPGSGKSTLARIIGDKTGLPVVHVDRIHHLPGWRERPRDEKIAMAEAVQAEPFWIIEGGLSATYESRFSRADTVIYLDLPLWLRSWQVFWRTWRHYGRTRPDMQEACPERFSLEFWIYIWRTRESGRQKPLALIARRAPGKRRYHLTSRREIRALVATLDGAGESGQDPVHGNA